MTTTMTREEAIAVLNETKLGLDIGLGGYAGTAAYKLANGDISATTDGLSERVVAAINAVGGDLDWDDADDELPVPAERSEAYHTGYEAHEHGEALSANPYPSGSWDFAQWADGWAAAD